MSPVAKIVAALTDPRAEDITDGFAVLAAFAVAMAFTAIALGLWL